MDHHDHAAQFRDRFWLSLALTVPVLLYSHHLQEWLGFMPPMFDGEGVVSPLFGSAIFLYGGQPFLVGGWGELRARRPGMMLLIGMAITVAWASSMAASLDLFDVEVWWELALLIDIMLLGHWMEMRAIGQAQGALAALAALLPDEAERVGDDGAVETVPIADLRVGDVVLVRPGAAVPADGTIAEGSAEIDESTLTGESRPVERAAGERVVASATVAGGALRVRVDAVGEDTALAGIQRLVAEAQESRSRTQALADRAAALLFWVALAAAAATALVWSLLGEPEAAVERAVTVLIIACPHALGLAIPLVTSIATAKAARAGILVKDRLSLERMRVVGEVLFDKTGTLTEGRHVVADVAALDGAGAGDAGMDGAGAGGAGAGDSDAALLALAAAVETDSEHPLARAIVAAAHDRGLDPPPAHDFSATAGRGVAARVDGAAVAVGGPALLRERGLSQPAALREEIVRWEERGAAVLSVVRDGAVVGALALEDRVRPESRQAVAALRRDGVAVAMITGDARAVAEAVARDLGIDHVFAEVLPEDKDGAVERLQAGGQAVAMVGDGVNDAPALARADVGIAIGAGTDVAIESAGIVLASDDPRAVAAVRRLSAATYRKMIQNLWWAAGYNLVAIPLAAGVLAWAGFVLPMAVGAVLMSVSTIVVALNAQLLRSLDLSPEAVGGDRAVAACAGSGRG
ncbi:Cu2+-exporting ATPase [Conexibacter arvalis]|uniref:Cu2+-exporting ATPase n=1 Tax=Conexibacter arvalis TaxID=912552 RepID=A0A840I8X2_9ACTN|nr:Cu2+-exporting ATPase [Conexibacter arvalis]